MAADKYISGSLLRLQQEEWIEDNWQTKLQTGHLANYPRSAEKANLCLLEEVEEQNGKKNRKEEDKGGACSCTSKSTR
jgi:hypothetical protein